MAQRENLRRVAQDNRDECQRKAIWEKCGAASHLEKQAINGKARSAAIEYGHPLRKPWGSFSDVVLAAPKKQMHRNLDLGVRCGLSKSGVELMLQTICRDHGRNKGTTKRKALRKAAGAGEGDSDGDYPPLAASRLPFLPVALVKRVWPIPHLFLPLALVGGAPSIPLPPPPPWTPTDLIPPFGTANKARPLSTLRF